MIEEKSGGVSASRSGVKVRRSGRTHFSTADQLERVLRWQPGDFSSGRYRIMLYRFLTDNIPVINSCIWTWVRLAAAPGKFRVECDSEPDREVSENRLQRMTDQMFGTALGEATSLSSMLPDLFTSFFRDGIFAGFLTVQKDLSGIDRFIPIDPINLELDEDNGQSQLYLDLNGRRLNLNRPDFYFLPYRRSVSAPFGNSILQAVPFVSYVEQQLIDDMRRASHNSGFHRLHVRITPPERQSGESDNAYTDRINSYFDSTVQMIKTLEVDDNPVTWDNVDIEHIAPGKSRDVTNSWFMSHRAMVEDICAGTHLAPYLLGYSYGATTTWSGFKFDVVMRQVRSVQEEVARFLEWIGNLELALAGLNSRCRFEFDNNFAYQAKDDAEIQSRSIDNILKLYQAGLLDQDIARDKACRII